MCWANYGYKPIYQVPPGQLMPSSQAWRSKAQETYISQFSKQVSKSLYFFLGNWLVCGQGKGYKVLEEESKKGHASSCYSQCVMCPDGHGHFSPSPPRVRKGHHAVFGNDHQTQEVIKKCAVITISGERLTKYCVQDSLLGPLISPHVC